MLLVEQGVLWVLPMLRLVLLLSEAGTVLETGCSLEGSFQDTIRTLNTLQTNASDLEQVKRERSDPQAQLEAMQGFLERTGMKVEDLDRLNVIHVTGTKGKGSVCAFAECILRNYGLKTGFYSSPHLVQVRERIRIDGQPISKEQFSKYFWLVYSRLKETKALRGSRRRQVPGGLGGALLRKGL
ncbi:folylpolyglutamate synthase, mitochondrial-like [Falco naumanni]|uniref:folylpolyglutamate synthase, mitochondrial-like n=1 Tax=Falco naumanni TaxID=148594 RepID=UPI001ADEB532|nr:folylpolyglutamate synthase, mitochondrial-like [Falco naumanni]